jgi:hypothetical protein
MDETTGELSRLFHPRRDRWDEHFRVQRGDGSIEGLPIIGRVTVACLRINRDVQREARRAWIQLKLYA